MWETCSVQLNVRLPQDIAERAREVQESDPDFLSRIVLYGLTRSSIYHQLRQGRTESVAPFPLDGEEGPAGAPRPENTPASEG